MICAGLKKNAAIHPRLAGASFTYRAFFLVLKTKERQRHELTIFTIGHPAKAIRNLYMQARAPCLLNLPRQRHSANAETLNLVWLMA